MLLYYDEPIEIASGSGRRVTDGEGSSYLDFFGGVLTNMIGYDIPEIRAAIDTQLDTGVVHTLDAVPDPPAGRAGREDRPAVRHPGRAGLLHQLRHRGQRGRAADGDQLPAQQPDPRGAQQLPRPHLRHDRHHRQPQLVAPRSLNPLNVSFLHSGDRLRGLLAGRDDADHIDAAVADMREVLATQTAGDVAALIAEPIQGVGGFVHAPDGMFAAYRKVLDETGILYISDEVQTGWGRTGEHFWGYQAHGVTPDLLTFAKGIGNGFALAGVVGRADVINSVHRHLVLHLRRQPAVHRGRQRRHRLPARRTICRRNAAEVGDDPARRPARGRSRHGSSAMCAARA